ncbi:hypothetical protein ACQ8FT_004406, partial [Yersinia enterocolitica]
VNNSTEEKKQPENDENRTTQETGEEQEITDFNTITEITSKKRHCSMNASHASIRYWHNTMLRRCHWKVHWRRK